jgi:hypothetical protein
VPQQTRDPYARFKAAFANYTPLQYPLAIQTQASDSHSSDITFNIDQRLTFVASQMGTGKSK